MARARADRLDGDRVFGGAVPALGAAAWKHHGLGSRVMTVLLSLPALAFAWSGLSLVVWLLRG